MANSIQSLTVIGVGFMGTGIAQVCAQSGLKVLIFDSHPQATEKALGNMRWSLEKLISKGRLEADPDEVLARITVGENLASIQGVDLVIEATYEDLQLKQELLQGICEIIPASSLIGTNTSSIPISLLSESVSHPERFIGIHFFGPVPLMGLVELVMGPQTSEQTLKRAKTFIQTIGKTPVVVRKESPGFLVNRIFAAVYLEAFRCLEEGVGSVEDIDTGMRLGYGWAAGPFEVADNAGLDIVAAVFTIFGGEPPKVILEKVEAGHLGRKTGQGFYRYDGPGGKKINAKS